jgi:N-acetylglucosamine kinase-like BadF-type ATPase
MVDLPTSERAGVLVGIEGGGTRTTCLIVGQDGSPRGIGSSGPSNVLVVGKSRTKESIGAAISRATRGRGLGKDVLALCVGAAGSGNPDGRRMMQEVLDELGLPGKRVVVHDGVISLVGATGGQPGVVIAAGTGTICFGMNSSGKFARSSGWGHIIGDEGSGYDIARRAMTAALRAHDLRGKPTALEKKLVEHLGLSSIEDLVGKVYAEGMSKDQISALAPLVLEAAREGDAVAVDILNDAGRELGLAVVAVVKQLGMADDAFEVVSAGTILESFGGFVVDPMRSTILESAPRARLTRARFEPVVGAIIVAAREAGVETGEAFFKNLEGGIRALRL